MKPRKDGERDGRRALHPMKLRQVSMTDPMWAGVGALAKAQGVSKSEIVRRAVDRELAREESEAET